MAIKPVIYWFRKDLRLHDNPALHHAVQWGRPIIPVFIFDDTLYQEFPGLKFPRTGVQRLKFLSETIDNLSESILKAGSRLLIFKGDTYSIRTWIKDFI